MCKRSEETVDHLLFHCEVAYALWSAFFWSVWVVLGDAETGFHYAHLLVVYGEEGECCGLEDGTYLTFSGVYGGRETIGPLRTWRGP